MVSAVKQLADYLGEQDMHTRNISNKSISTNLYNIVQALIEDLNARAVSSGGVNKSQSWYSMWILLQRLGENVISLPFSNELIQTFIVIKRQWVHLSIQNT